MEYLDIVSDTVTHFITDNYPLLNIAHIILTVFACHQEWNAAHAKLNPLATYICSLACTNAGGLLIGLITGTGSPLSNLLFGNVDPFQFIIFNITWWCMFYAPYGAFVKLIKRSPIIEFLYVSKELLRCKKIWTGVALGVKLYSGKGDSWEHIPFCIVLGTIASCGTGFMVNLGHSIAMRPYNGRILLSTSVFTKISIVLALIYTLFPNHKSYVVLAQCIYMISYKLHLLQNEICTTAFGACGWAITDMLNFEEKEDTETKKKDSKKTK